MIQVAKMIELLLDTDRFYFVLGLVGEFLSRVQFFVALALFIFGLIKNILALGFIIEVH